MGHGPRHCFTLRQKPIVDGRLTDQQMFQRLELGDVWRDAQLVDVFFYLLQSNTLVIPDTWHKTMMDFKLELEAYDAWLQSKYSCSWGSRFSLHGEEGLHEVTTADDLGAFAEGPLAASWLSLQAYLEGQPGAFRYEFGAKATPANL